MTPTSGDHTDKLRQVSRELADCFQRGEEPSLNDWQQRHPDLAEDLDRLFQDTVRFRVLGPLPTHKHPAPTPTSPTLGKILRQVGDYDIVRELGRGGMGVVYEAEQRSLRRRVALKVLPLQVAHDRNALDRFRREARSAAQLHHTNIVPVFEVGQEGDVCYYVMQYIEGCGLDMEIVRRRHDPARFADHQRRVAQLGEHVAHALAYAHERGIMHRDIKPANLLLDDSGTVWITDFGLAKGSGDNLTVTGDIVGTIGFMAPERFRGQCDSRADIYSLGLTLYEFLLLQPAYPPTDHVQLMEQVQRVEPPRPRTVNPRVERDLETIILKATDKDPARRYQTAAALAEDLRRFQADEPIEARPVGMLERAVRAARHNPRLAALLALVGVLLVTLVAGAIVAAVTFSQQADAAKSAQAKAEDETKAAHEIATFLLGLLEEADPMTLSRRALGPHTGSDHHISPLETLNLAAERLKTAFHDRPAMRAALLAKVGAVYVSFGQFSRAKPLLDEALTLRQHLFPADHLDLAESWHHLGYFHQAQFDRAEAVQAYEKALAIRTKLLAPDDALVAETLIHLGFLKSQTPEATDGEDMLRRARDIQAKRHGLNSREYGVALIALFQYHYHRSENLKLVQLALDTERFANGAGRDNKLVQAIYYFIQGQTEKRRPTPNYIKAAEKYERALELGEPLIGKTHYFALLGRKELAFLYLEDLNKPDEAAKQFHIAYDRLELMNEEKSAEAAYVLMHWGRCLLFQKKCAEAEQLLRKSVNIMRTEKGDLGRALHNLAEALGGCERWREAEDVAAEALPQRKARATDSKWSLYETLDFYVNVLVRHGKTDQAIAAIRAYLPDLDLHTQPSLHFPVVMAQLRGRLCLLLGDRLPELRKEEVAKAMASLRRAVEGGFRDEVTLTTDPNLAPLRALPEFKSLLRKT